VCWLTWRAISPRPCAEARVNAAAEQSLAQLKVGLTLQVQTRDNGSWLQHLILMHWSSQTVPAVCHSPRQLCVTHRASCVSLTAPAVCRWLCQLCVTGCASCVVTGCASCVSLSSDTSCVSRSAPTVCCRRRKPPLCTQVDVKLR
jgi:hypothetical protein